MTSHLQMYGMPLPDDTKLDPIGLLRLWDVISPQEARLIKRGVNFLRNIISPVFRERGYNSTIYLNTEKCPTAIYERGDTELVLVEFITEKDWSDEERVHLLPLGRHALRQNTYTNTRKGKAYYRKLIEDLEGSSNQNKASSSQEN